MVTKSNTVKKKSNYTTKIKPIINTYTNTSKANVFTENGRCMPGETIELMEEQAVQYNSLELVK